MKTYLLTLIAASLIVALIGILSPDGEKGGIAKHMKLVTSLFLVCVLIAPLQTVIEGLQSLIDGSFEIIGTENDYEEDYRAEMESTLDHASTSYFTEMLTQTIAEQFSISPSDLRCEVAWQTDGDGLTPSGVTVILSGKAIWQDPKAIANFVTELIGCECVTAIE